MDRENGQPLFPPFLLVSKVDAHVRGTMVSLVVFVGPWFVRSFVDSVSARSGIVVALVRRLLHSPRFRVCLGGEGGVDLTGLRSRVLLEGKSVLRHFETRPNRPPPYCRRFPSRLAPIRQRRGWLETARTRASLHAFSLRLLPPSSFFFSAGSPSLRYFRCPYLSFTFSRRLRLLLFFSFTRSLSHSLSFFLVSLSLRYSPDFLSLCYSVLFHCLLLFLFRLLSVVCASLSSSFTHSYFTVSLFSAIPYSLSHSFLFPNTRFVTTPLLVTSSLSPSHLF